MAKLHATPLDPATYPHAGAFGQLLTWHLAWGTRPNCNIDKQNHPWVKSEFAQLVHEEGFDVKSAERSLRNWTNHGRLPDAQDAHKIARVFQELFDDDPNLRHWKGDLEYALERGRKQQAARIAKREIVEPLSVPQPSDQFMGRGEDVKKLAMVLVSSAGPLAVLVQGGPGIGKTELTKAVAHNARITARFGQRRWFVPLETVTSAGAMQYAIVRALGCDPKNDFGGALDMLREKPALIVLDNLETPWENIGEREATEAILADLAAVPGIALLASMRGQEWVKRPTWLTHPISVLSHKNAAGLFAEIAGPWVHEDPAFDDFLTALGGLPLAIELVARRAHGRHSLMPLWREWLRIGVDFANDNNFPEGRLTSLSRSIEMSVQSLRMKQRPEASLLLSFIGVLPSGITEEERNALIGSSGYSAEERLVQVGLVIERFGRIDLLPPIREHVSRRCKPNENDLDVLIHYYMINMNIIFDAHDGCSHEEFDNFEAVLFSIFREGSFNYLKDNIEAFSWICCILNRSSSLLRELAKAFRIEGKIDDEAYCFWHLGDIAYRSREYESGAKHATKAANLYQVSGNITRQIDSLRMVGRCEEKIHYDYLGQDFMDEDEIKLESRYYQVKSVYNKARSISHDNRLIDYEALCITDMASFDFCCWNHEAAQAGYAEASELYETLNDEFNMKHCTKTIKQRLDDNEHEY